MGNSSEPSALRRGTIAFVLGAMLVVSACDARLDSHGSGATPEDADTNEDGLVPPPPEEDADPGPDPDGTPDADAGSDEPDASTDAGDDAARDAGEMDASTDTSADVTDADAEPDAETDAGQPPCEWHTLYEDADGDGYGSNASMHLSCGSPAGSTTTGGDCNDANSAIHPGLEETCDGADTNCDGVYDLIGEDDRDGDGYLACTECNDFNGAIRPGLPELCNGFDDNCDGLLDDADSSVAGGAIWYQDADNDSWGDLGVTRFACLPPFGYVNRAGDCYDYNDLANPDSLAAVDGPRGDASFDYDCDGLETPTETRLYECTIRSDGTCRVLSPGWRGGSVPACGEGANFGRGCEIYYGSGGLAHCRPNNVEPDVQYCY